MQSESNLAPVIAPDLSCEFFCIELDLALRTPSSVSLSEGNLYTTIGGTLFLIYDMYPQLYHLLMVIINRIL